MDDQYAPLPKSEVEDRVLAAVAARALCLEGDDTWVDVLMPETDSFTRKEQRDYALNCLGYAVMYASVLLVSVAETLETDVSEVIEVVSRRMKASS